MINGVLYFSTPDHAYAVDARTGRELWHYIWPSTGGNHLGNRGMGALGDTLYFETPDCHLVALNMKDGTKRWDKAICSMEQFYYASVAPVIIKNHVIAGVSGDDMDNPGYLDAHDPVTGERQWRWYAVPQKMDEPGSDTWPNEEVMKHGGGMTWQPVTYDPDAESDLRHDRQSAAGDRAQESRGRQPVHRIDRRAQRRHRQDGVVLPVVAARHARLGLDADGRAHRRRDRRQAAQAHRAGRAQRPLLRARPHQRQGDRLDASTSRRTGRWATTRRGSRFRIRRRCRRSTARSSRPIRAARPTGSRRASVR